MFSSLWVLVYLVKATWEQSLQATSHCLSSCFPALTAWSRLLGCEVEERRVRWKIGTVHSVSDSVFWPFLQDCLNSSSFTFTHFLFHRLGNKVNKLPEGDPSMILIPVRISLAMFLHPDSSCWLQFPFLLLLFVSHSKPTHRTKLKWSPMSGTKWWWSSQTHKGILT